MQQRVVNGNIKTRKWNRKYKVLLCYFPQEKLNVYTRLEKKITHAFLTGSVYEILDTLVKY